MLEWGSDRELEMWYLANGILYTWGKTQPGARILTGTASTLQHLVCSLHMHGQQSRWKGRLELLAKPSFWLHRGCRRDPDLALRRDAEQTSAVVGLPGASSRVEALVTSGL